MSSSNCGTILAEQELLLVGPNQLIVPLTAGLSYSSEDPYALTMSFDAGQDEPVRWTFGRDLLAGALHSPQGLGDVQAWPSAASAAAAGNGAGAGEKIVNIVLGPPGGSALFEAAAAGIEAFLAQTYELVPDGQEVACLDLDAELTEFLSQA